LILPFGNLLESESKKNYKTNVDSPLLKHAEFEIVRRKARQQHAYRKTRESVAKSPQAVNEKNIGQAWGNAYNALLQFKWTQA